MEDRTAPHRRPTHPVGEIVMSDAAVDALIRDLRRVDALLRAVDDAPSPDPMQPPISGESDG